MKEGGARSMWKRMGIQIGAERQEIQENVRQYKRSISVEIRRYGANREKAGAINHSANIISVGSRNGTPPQKKT